MQQDKRCLQDRFVVPQVAPQQPNPSTCPSYHITSHHCHLLWPKAPFGPNPSSGSAHTPPSSQPLCMLMSPLSPWPRDPARRWGGRGDSDGSRTLDNWPLCACQMYFSFPVCMEQFLSSEIFALRVSVKKLLRVKWRQVHTPHVQITYFLLLK